MKVRFLVEGGKATTLTVPTGATVGDAKGLLSEPISLPPADQILVHSGKVLADSQSISSLDFRRRAFILVAKKASARLVSSDDFPMDLLRQIPASKILHWRQRLDRDCHQFNHILEKLAGADKALLERLQSCPEEIVTFLGLNYETFCIRRLLRPDNSTAPVAKRKPPAPPPPDKSFDLYPVNLVEIGSGTHRPADTQPALEPDAAGAGDDAIERLVRMGMDRGSAERLLRDVGGDFERAAMFLLMHTLGLRF
jgi:hypothetical protein